MGKNLSEEDINWTNAFFKELTNKSLPRSDKCTPSLRKSWACLMDMSGYFKEAPHNCFTTNEAMAELTLVLQVSPSLLDRHKNQLLRGKMCDHTIVVFGSNCEMLANVAFIIFCKPFKWWRGLPISLPPQCIIIKEGCLLPLDSNISWMVGYNWDHTIPLIPFQIILWDVSPKLLLQFCCTYFCAQWTIDDPITQMCSETICNTKTS